MVSSNAKFADYAGMILATIAIPLEIWNLVLQARIGLKASSWDILLINMNLLFLFEFLKSSLYQPIKQLIEQILPFAWFVQFVFLFGFMFGLDFDGENSTAFSVIVVRCIVVVVTIINSLAAVYIYQRSNPVQQVTILESSEMECGASK